MSGKKVGTAYLAIMPSTENIGSNLEKLFSGTGTSSGKKFNGAFLKVAGKLATSAAVAGIAKGLTDIVKKSVESYAEFEQLKGGIETLFGTGGQSLAEYAEATGQSQLDAVAGWRELRQSQQDVLDNAQTAYARAGLSANDYMETVTGFAASLKQSFDDTPEGIRLAAAAADQAVVDMADNANKLGTPMESIQNAYAGFAKQNYTMLDNLKLGYGGTKDEMQRLLADAQAVSGVKYDIANLNDVYSAIHVIQTEMGITGTTAQEAQTTIQGSLGMTKAAWENVLTALGSGEGLDEAIGNLVSSAETFAGNLVPVIGTVLQGVVQALPQLISAGADFIPQLVETLVSMTPDLLLAGLQLIDGLIEGVVQGFGKLLKIAWEKAQGFISQVKGWFGIASPSKVFAEIGGYLDEGLAEGIRKSSGVVDIAANGLAERVTGRLGKLGDINADMTSPIAGRSVVQLNLNVKELTQADRESLVLEINRSLGGMLA